MGARDSDRLGAVVGLFGSVGKQTVQDLHQYVMAWLDQAGRVLQELARENTVKVTIEIVPRKEKP